MKVNKILDFLIFFCAIFLSAVIALQAAEKNIVLKGDVDFLSNHQLESGGNTGGTDVKIGYSLASELHFKHGQNWRYGFGIAYQFPREQLIEGDTGKKFSFFPVYGLLEVNIAPAMAMKPAFIIHGGYNFFNGNGYYRGQSKLSGGFYTAAGFNMALHENVRMEMMYKWHRGYVKEESNVRINYRYLSFALCIIL